LTGADVTRMIASTREEIHYGKIAAFL